MDNMAPFKWRHFEAEIILLCLRWYLRSALSYRDLEEMMLELGLQVDHTTIYRYRATLRSRTRKMLSAASESLQRLLEFLLSPTRNAEAAKRFFVTALR